MWSSSSLPCAPQCAQLLGSSLRAWFRSLFQWVVLVRLFPLAHAMLRPPSLVSCSGREPVAAPGVLESWVDIGVGWRQD